MNALSFNVSRVFDRDAGEMLPVCLIECHFMSQKRDMYLSFKEFETLKNIVGMTTADIIGRLFRSVPCVKDIDDEFIKMFGAGMDEEFKKVVEAVEKMYDDYIAEIATDRETRHTDNDE